MMDKFVAGDMVVHVDGGCRLRVEVIARAVDGTCFYECSWIENGVPRSGRFAEVNLKAVQPRIGGVKRDNIGLN